MSPLSLCPILLNYKIKNNILLVCIFDSAQDSAVWSYATLIFYTSPIESKKGVVLKMKGVLPQSTSGIS